MFGLSDNVLKALQAYFANTPEIKQVKIYGSRAMGNYTKGSDIDLAIWTNTQNDISGRIKNDLEELPTPYLFDVTDYKTITHQPLKEHIDRVGKVLYPVNSE